MPGPNMFKLVVFGTVPVRVVPRQEKRLLQLWDDATKTWKKHVEMGIRATTRGGMVEIYKPNKGMIPVGRLNRLDAVVDGRPRYQGVHGFNLELIYHNKTAKDLWKYLQEKKGATDEIGNLMTAMRISSKKTAASTESLNKKIEKDIKTLNTKIGRDINVFHKIVSASVSKSNKSIEADVAKTNKQLRKMFDGIISKPKK
jgi:hypothetical protein